MEALRGFQSQYRIHFPEEVKRYRHYGTQEITLLQGSWNRYIKANKAYHDGQYVPASDPNFLT